MVVQRARRRAAAPDAQRAGHAEMHEQCAITGMEQQVLAATLDAVDHGASQAFGQVGGNWPAQAPVVHVDLYDAPADYVGRDTAPGRFDFRKFGHGMRFWASPGETAVPAPEECSSSGAFVSAATIA